MLEVFIAIALGIGFGVLTGLTPGIHVNLISVLAISIAIPFSPLAIACFIISMSVVHSFLDIIPSIYLGAPDASTVLGVLPGHRYILKGLGYQAVKLTVIGSFFSLLLSLSLIPFLIPIIAFIYPKVQPFIGYILVLIVLYMILQDQKKWWSLFVFTISGIFGYIVLNTYNIPNPLFPMLSGLFGISTLLYSLKDTHSLPKQEFSTKIFIKKWHATKAIISSTFAGFLTSMFPGMGSSQGAIIAMNLARNIGDHRFMILQGGINTVNFVLSLVTLYVLDKARNGAVIAVKKLVEEITISHLFVYGSTALIAGGFGVIVTLYIARVFSKFVSKLNYNILVWCVIGFIAMLVIILCGFSGILILFCGTAIGFIPAIVKCGRTHAMGCLLVPVILFFLNI